MELAGYGASVCMLLRRPCATHPGLSAILFCVGQVDKHRLVSELGVNYRDVRILDPLVRS